LHRYKNKALSDTQTSASFYVIGISYKKADASTRGYFSVDHDTQQMLLSEAQHHGVDALTIISTCNRTELYAFAANPQQLIHLLCTYTRGDATAFKKVAYVYEGNEAVRHLFRVGTGLDSQILGDFEIIGQLKSGFKKSKKHGLMNPFMERLINAVIQASKRIKNETHTGKIGRNTCENLIKHTKNTHITLINRTKAKAEKIAGKFNLIVKDYATIQSEIAQTDILVVATGAPLPTINKSLIHAKRPLLILDLSIPKNVDSDIEELDHVTVVHLDQLSRMTDETLKRRQQYIPQAEQIIVDIKAEFDTWLQTRSFAPTVNALKQRLTDIKAAEIATLYKKNPEFDKTQADEMGDRLIQKITNQVAHHLRNANGTTDESIDLITSMFRLDKTRS